MNRLPYNHTLMDNNLTSNREDHSILKSNVRKEEEEGTYEVGRTDQTAGWARKKRSREKGKGNKEKKTQRRAL